MNKKLRYGYFLILALSVIVFRMPSIDVPLDTDSSANAFFARHMIAGETLYDKFHPAHHLPAIFYTFELAFKLFGDSPMAPKLLLFPFMIASAWLVFLMGRMLFDDFTGFLAGIFFVMVSSQQYLSGLTAEMELFACLPLIATTFLFLILLRRNAAAVQFGGVGILGAICVLYKVTFVAPLMTAVLCILMAGWLERNKVGNIKNIIFRLGAIGAGFLLPLMLVGAYFASQGLWQRLLLVFTLGFTYFGDTTLTGGQVVFPKPFGFPLFIMAVNNIAMLAFGLVGTYRLLRRAIPLRGMQSLTDLTLVVWLIISFALAGLRGGGFTHYVLVVTPPLAFMCAIEISLAYQRWQIAFTRAQTVLGLTIMLALVFANFFWRDYDLYRTYIPYKLGEISFEEFAYRYSQDREQIISDYIRSHTTPHDFIYVWSIHVQPYYFADRTPPIDILWPSYVAATGSPQRIFNMNTKYILVDDPKIFSRPQWLIDGLARDYHLETIIGGQEIYRRNDSG